MDHTEWRVLGSKLKLHSTDNSHNVQTQTDLHHHIHRHHGPHWVMGFGVKTETAQQRQQSQRSNTDRLHHHVHDHRGPQGQTGLICPKPIKTETLIIHTHDRHGPWGETGLHFSKTTKTETLIIHTDDCLVSKATYGIEVNRETHYSNHYHLALCGGCKIYERLCWELRAILDSRLQQQQSTKQSINYTTLLPGANTIALRLFCGAMYTPISHSRQSYIIKLNYKNSKHQVSG